MKTLKKCPTGWARTAFLILLGFFSLAGISGCVQGDCDVTVNWDGSALLNYELNLDFPLPDSFPQETLDDFADKNGYQAQVSSDSSHSQILLSKKLESFEELPAAIQETVDLTGELVDTSLAGPVNSTSNNSSNNNKNNSTQQPDKKQNLNLPGDLPQPPVSTKDLPLNLPMAAKSQVENAITCEEGIFIDTYHVNASIDLRDIKPYDPDSDIISLGLSVIFDTIANDADLKFRIHLPLAAGTNNATTVSDGGKTLEWQLNPGEQNYVQFSLDAPNLLNIGLTLGLLLVLLLASFGIYWFLVRHA